MKTYLTLTLFGTLVMTQHVRNRNADLTLPQPIYPEFRMVTYGCGGGDCRPNFYVIPQGSARALSCAAGRCVLTTFNYWDVNRNLWCYQRPRFPDCR